MYLLHIHNSENENYSLHASLLNARNELAEYVAYWWSDSIQDEELPDPITKEDADYFWSESGEWANIVYLDLERLDTDVLGQGAIWSVKE